MLNKVTEYKILCSSRINSLEALVNESLKDGWTPSGPIFDYKDSLNQTMVKFGQGQ